MEPTLIGYFPKKTATRPDWLKVSHVEEICSASECISVGPLGWIEAWEHNGNWLFNSPEVAWGVTGDAKREFEMYAFAQYPFRLEDGQLISEPMSSTAVVPLPENFELLGYDAVARSCGTTFECSPLSCNRGASSMTCNSHCLFDTLEAAIEGAKEFSHGPWEPGPYYVVAVYRERRGSAGRHGSGERSRT